MHVAVEGRGKRTANTKKIRRKDNLTNKTELLAQKEGSWWTNLSNKETLHTAGSASRANELFWRLTRHEKRKSLPAAMCGRKKSNNYVRGKMRNSKTQTFKTGS